ncbi:MAG: glycosyltransferase family 4 protein [Paramuribaculum sp.]|nr:glycosyltransferase family 4 protein [Paramuribaculum sp.]
MTKILLTSTVPQSLDCFCRGLFLELTDDEYDVAVSSSPGRELQEINRREGVRVYPVPMMRRIAPFSDILSLFKLIKVIRREKPLIIHSFTPKAGLLTMMAAKICRVPLRIHTFTGLMFPTAKGLKRHILKLTDRLTCKLASHIVPEGFGVKADLEKWNITKKPLKVLGYGNVRGIDLDYYDPAIPELKKEAEKLRDDSVFTFVFIGRIVRDKGIDELITAFLSLRKDIPSIRLFLIGESELDSNPISPATRQAIIQTDAIISTGFQEDVRPWLLASDCLVLPSYREGMPNVVIEAGAMGLPAIVTDINGSNEIIVDGENGLIVPPNAVLPLQNAMKIMVFDPQTRSLMASRARLMISSRFDRRHVRACLKNFYLALQKDLPDTPKSDSKAKHKGNTKEL